MLIEIVYTVEPARAADFITALRRFSSVRLRDGAIRWEAWEDAAEPGLILESFVVESWLEHQRQHRRVTRIDEIDQATLNAFHIGSTPPTVRHFLRA